MTTVQISLTLEDVEFPPGANAMGAYLDNLSEEIRGVLNPNEIITEIKVVKQ